MELRGFHGDRGRHPACPSTSRREGGTPEMAPIFGGLLATPRGGRTDVTEKGPKCNSTWGLPSSSAGIPTRSIHPSPPTSGTCHLFTARHVRCPPEGPLRCYTQHPMCTWLPRAPTHVHGCYLVPHRGKKRHEYLTSPRLHTAESGRASTHPRGPTPGPSSSYCITWLSSNYPLNWPVRSH